MRMSSEMSRNSSCDNSCFCTFFSLSYVSYFTTQRWKLFTVDDSSSQNSAIEKFHKFLIGNSVKQRNQESWGMLLTFLFLARGLAVDESGDLKHQRLECLLHGHRPDLEVFGIPGGIFSLLTHSLCFQPCLSHHRAAMDPTISAIVILKFPN